MTFSCESLLIFSVGYMVEGSTFCPHLTVLEVLSDDIVSPSFVHKPFGLPYHHNDTILREIPKNIMKVLLYHKNLYGDIFTGIG